MWWTPYGERALKGAEWRLFREGLDLSWDWVEDSMDDPDLWPFDVEAFDVLQPSQRLALLAEVGNALKDESHPHPELTAHNEATIAAIFSNITTQVALEIDLASEIEDWGDPTCTRKLVLAAYLEVVEQDVAEVRNASNETEVAVSRRTPPTVEIAEDDDNDDEVWSPLELDSNDLEAWEDLLDCLANRILWDDDDYEMGDEFLDVDPRVSRAKMELMRIPDDYYTAIAPDPTENELVAIRQQLRRLCGRPETRPAR
jgi:hypothetical protein